MAADWDRAALRETQPADAYDADGDAYDADPDAENYAAGMDPETVYRNQGSPDGAGGWDRYLAEAPETDGASEDADLWGGVDPDEANYADLDEPEPPREAEPVPDAEQPLSPEQRISELEAKNAEFGERLAATERELAESRQETADARQDAAESKQDAAEAWQVATEAKQDAAEARQDAAESKQNAAESTRENAELRAELGQTNTRMDRLEQVVAALADHNAQAVVTGDHHGTIAEGKATDQTMDARDAQPSRWRRATSGENLALAGAVLGTVETVAQLAPHASLDGVGTAAATALTLVGLGMTKIENMKKEKRKS